MSLRAAEKGEAARVQIPLIANSVGRVDVAEEFLGNIDDAAGEFCFWIGGLTLDAADDDGSVLSLEGCCWKFRREWQLCKLSRYEVSFNFGR